MNKIDRITCYRPDGETVDFVMRRRGNGFDKGHYCITDASIRRLESTCLRMTGKINVLPMGWSWRRGIE